MWNKNACFQIKKIACLGKTDYNGIRDQAQYLRISRETGRMLIAMKKKLSIMAAAVLALAICLTGCAQKLDGKETVAVMDETNIPLAEVNLLIRYQQAQAESYYGGMLGGSVYGMDLDGDGVVDGELARESTAGLFEEMYVLEAEAAGYGVELSAEEKAAIEAAADTFVKANKLNPAKDYLAVNREDVVHLLELLTVHELMYQTLTADVEVEVTDEEAAQKKATYLYFSTRTTDAEGNSTVKEGEALEEVKAKADQALADIKGGKTITEVGEALEMSPYTFTFDDETEMFPADVRPLVDELGEGEVSDVLASEFGYYVVFMESLMDPEATAAKKLTLEEEARMAVFDEEVTALKAGHSFELNEDVLKKITFDRVVTLKTAQ